MIDGALISEYYAERKGMKLIEKPNGFIYYRIIGEECFLGEMFIRRQARGTRLIRTLFGELEEIALNKGCKIISATVSVLDPGKDHTISSSLKLGFKILKAEHGVVLIGKEL